MKQLGNLAVVCAKRPDVLFQLLNGTVTVFVGHGPARASMYAHWTDDDRIREMVRELNFGRYRETELPRAA